MFDIEEITRGIVAGVKWSVDFILFMFDPKYHSAIRWVLATLSILIIAALAFLVMKIL